MKLCTCHRRKIFENQVGLSAWQLSRILELDCLRLCKQRNAFLLIACVIPVKVFKLGLHWIFVLNLNLNFNPEYMVWKCEKETRYTLSQGTVFFPPDFPKFRQILTGIDFSQYMFTVYWLGLNEDLKIWTKWRSDAVFSRYVWTCPCRSQFCFRLA